MNKKIGVTKVKLLIQSVSNWKDALVDLTGLSYSGRSETHQKIVSNEGYTLAETVVNLHPPLKGKALWLHSDRWNWDIVKTKDNFLLLVPTLKGASRDNSSTEAA